MLIRVKALRHVMGLRRGEEAYVEATSKTEALIRVGYLRWLDKPVAEPVVVEEKPKPKRRPRKKIVVTEDFSLDSQPLPEIQSASFYDEPVPPASFYDEYIVGNDLGQVLDPDEQ